MSELINESAVGPEARFICGLLLLMGYSLSLRSFTLQFLIIWDIY